MGRVASCFVSALAADGVAFDAAPDTNTNCSQSKAKVMVKKVNHAHRATAAPSHSAGPAALPEASPPTPRTRARLTQLLKAPYKLLTGIIWGKRTPSNLPFEAQVAPVLPTSAVAANTRSNTQFPSTQVSRESTAAHAPDTSQDKVDAANSQHRLYTVKDYDADYRREADEICKAVKSQGEDLLNAGGIANQAARARHHRLLEVLHENGVDLLKAYKGRTPLQDAERELISLRARQKPGELLPAEYRQPLQDYRGNDFVKNDPEHPELYKKRVATLKGNIKFLKAVRQERNAAYQHRFEAVLSKQSNDVIKKISAELAGEGLDDRKIALRKLLFLGSQKDEVIDDFWHRFLRSPKEDQQEKTLCTFCKEYFSEESHTLEAGIKTTEESAHAYQAFLDASNQRLHDLSALAKREKLLVDALTGEAAPLMNELRNELKQLKRQQIAAFKSELECLKRSQFPYITSLKGEGLQAAPVLADVLIQNINTTFPRELKRITEKHIDHLRQAGENMGRIAIRMERGARLTMPLFVSRLEELRHQLGKETHTLMETLVDSYASIQADLVEEANVELKQHIAEVESAIKKAREKEGAALLKSRTEPADSILSCVEDPKRLVRLGQRDMQQRKEEIARDARILQHANEVVDAFSDRVIEILKPALASLQERLDSGMSMPDATRARLEARVAELWGWAHQAMHVHMMDLPLDERRTLSNNLHISEQAWVEERFHAHCRSLAPALTPIEKKELRTSHFSRQEDKWSEAAPPVMVNQWLQCIHEAAECGEYASAFEMLLDRQSYEHMPEEVRRQCYVELLQEHGAQHITYLDRGVYHTHAEFFDLVALRNAFMLFETPKSEKDRANAFAEIFSNGMFLIDHADDFLVSQLLRKDNLISIEDAQHCIDVFTHRTLLGLAEYRNPRIFQCTREVVSFMAEKEHLVPDDAAAAFKLLQRILKNDVLGYGIKQALVAEVSNKLREPIGNKLDAGDRHALRKAAEEVCCGRMDCRLLADIEEAILGHVKGESSLPSTFFQNMYAAFTKIRQDTEEPLSAVREMIEKYPFIYFRMHEKEWPVFIGVDRPVYRQMGKNAEVCASAALRLYDIARHAEELDTICPTARDRLKLFDALIELAKFQTAIGNKVHVLRSRLTQDIQTIRSHAERIEADMRARLSSVEAVGGSALLKDAAYSNAEMGSLAVLKEINAIRDNYMEMLKKTVKAHPAASISAERGLLSRFYPTAGDFLGEAEGFLSNVFDPLALQLRQYGGEGRASNGPVYREKLGRSGRKSWAGPTLSPVISPLDLPEGRFGAKPSASGAVTRTSKIVAAPGLPPQPGSTEEIMRGIPKRTAGIAEEEIDLLLNEFQLVRSIEEAQALVCSGIIDMPRITKYLSARGEFERLLLDADIDVTNEDVYSLLVGCLEKWKNIFMDQQGKIRRGIVDIQGLDDLVNMLSLFEYMMRKNEKTKLH